MKSIRPLRFWCYAGVVMLLMLGGCGQGSTTGAQDSPVGTSDVHEATPVAATTPESAHNFTLASLDGEAVTLSDLRGQWVLLNFWATWCAPCRKEMPYLEKVAQERNIQVLGINFNEDPSTVADFIAEEGITFDILMEPDDITLLMYQARGLPRTVVVAPDGTIATTIAGIIDPTHFDRWMDDQGIGPIP